MCVCFCDFPRSTKRIKNDQLMIENALCAHSTNRRINNACSIVQCAYCTYARPPEMRLNALCTVCENIQATGHNSTRHLRKKWKSGWPALHPAPNVKHTHIHGIAGSSTKALSLRNSNNRHHLKWIIPDANGSRPHTHHTIAQRNLMCVYTAAYHDRISVKPQTT